MNLINKSEKMTNYIRECWKLIHKQGHKIARNYGLTFAQYHLLILLEHNNKKTLTIGEIAKKCDKAQNTISERISILEEKKLVKRINDSSDRRIIRVLITQEGENLVYSIRKQRSNEFVLNAIKEIKEEKIDDLLDGLEELLIKLRKEK